LYGIKITRHLLLADVDESFIFGLGILHEGISDHGGVLGSGPYLAPCHQERSDHLIVIFDFQEAPCGFYRGFDSWQQGLCCNIVLLEKAAGNELFHITGLSIECAWRCRTGGCRVSIDRTPRTILARLEGTGYWFMSGSTKGIGGTFAIITHGSWLLASLEKIIFKFFIGDVLDTFS
jgi:hypothetical protein